MTIHALARSISQSLSQQMARCRFENATMLDRASGISRTTIQNTLDCTHTPRLETLLLLAEALDCELSVTLTPKQAT